MMIIIITAWVATNAVIGYIIIIIIIINISLSLMRKAVATKDSSVARSLKLGTSTSVNTWMGDHHERPGAVNLGSFVGVDINLWPTVHYAAVIVLTRTKKLIKPNQTKLMSNNLASLER